MNKIYDTFEMIVLERISHIFDYDIPGEQQQPSPQTHYIFISFSHKKIMGLKNHRGSFLFAFGFIVCATKILPLR